MTVDLNEAGGLLKVRTVAAALCMSEYKVYKLIKGSELPAVKLGTDYRVDPVDLREYIDTHRTKERVSNSTKELKQALAEKVFSGEMTADEAVARLEGYKKANKEAKARRKAVKAYQKPLRDLEKQRDRMYPEQAALQKAVRGTVTKAAKPEPKRIVRDDFDGLREVVLEQDRQMVIKSAQEAKARELAAKKEAETRGRLIIDPMTGTVSGAHGDHFVSNPYGRI